MFVLLLILLQHGNPVQMSAETDFACIPNLALEPFDEFFNRFRASKHFQMKRTVFPLEEIDIRLESETSTATQIEKRLGNRSNLIKMESWSQLVANP